MRISVIIISVLFLFTGTFLVQAQSVPATPFISIAPQLYYPLDEVLYIEGRAEPKSKVDLYFEKSGAQPVRVSVQTNLNGEWFFGERLELAAGDWSLRVRVESDLPSDWSNPRIIRSVVSGLVIGGFKLRYTSAFLVLLGLITIAVLLIIYAFLRLRRVREREREEEFKEQTSKLEKRLHEEEEYHQKSVALGERLKGEIEFREKTASLEKQLRGKEIESAVTAIEAGFADLREQLIEELRHLEAKMTKGSLTPEEEEHRNRLLRQLREIEEQIENKLKQL